MDISRRGFLGGSVGAGALWALGARGAAAIDSLAAAGEASPPVVVFTKHLQFLEYAELAVTAKGLGVDGLDLTVRKGGHVLPERVAEDLPRAVGLIQAQGLTVPMITTELKSGGDAYARDILKQASALGIRYFRIGGHVYEKGVEPMVTLDKVTEDLKSLAALAEEYDMVAGYHNHSGRGYVGAPLWDLREVYERVGSEHLGSNLDFGHTTVEGALGDWEITTRVMARYTKMVAVKDFRWTENKPEWLALGKGVVKTEDMLRMVLKRGFRGPISVHHEYPVPSNEVLLEEIKASVKLVRDILTRAGFGEA